MQADIVSAPDQESILVVEGEILARMIIADYLRKCGYRVLEAASGEQALAILKDTRIKIDVVLSDLQMPGARDGFTLSQWIKANRPDIEVVLTGSVQQSADAAGKLCDDGPLPKPYHPQIVVDRIRRLRARKSSKH